MYPKYFKI